LRNIDSGEIVDTFYNDANMQQRKWVYIVPRKENDKKNRQPALSKIIAIPRDKSKAAKKMEIRPVINIQVS
jgi:hypothetical protein